MKQAPIDTIWRPFNYIFKKQITVGILLMLSVVIALVWANSPWRHSYHALWEIEFTIGTADYFLKKSLHHWINDALMSIFFFSVGLEIKREILAGELSSWREAALPAAAALGGMIVPAGIYLAINYQGEGVNGWGVPMATDIAFTLGIIALIGNRIPTALKVFLTALAIVDDIGAVLVIAFFYTASVDLNDLLIAGGFLVVMIGGNLLGIRNYFFYISVGIFGIWLAILFSGIHATIAGVLAALGIPSRTKIEMDKAVDKLDTLAEELDETEQIEGEFITEKQVRILNKVKTTSARAETVSQRLEYYLSPFVSFFIMPVFALANAGVEIQGDLLTLLTHPVSIGVMVGLLAGKFLGVSLFSHGAVALGMAQLPQGIRWKQLYGVALLAGVGFTMSLFITDLAFEKEQLASYAKVGILMASTLAALLGLGILYLSGEKSSQALH